MAAFQSHEIVAVGRERIFHYVKSLISDVGRREVTVGAIYCSLVYIHCVDGAGNICKE